MWGGRRLERLGKALPDGVMVGESWEVADLATTSPSGGGGGAARSVIANGPSAGATIHQAVAAWGSALLGEGWADSADFPLLVKLLDAREHLSVQVHPTPAYAARHPGAHVKTESWYVIDAALDAVLYFGLEPGVTRDDVLAAIPADRVADLLRAVPAAAGDCHHLPSGTIHALGAGVLVAEFQSPSDTTFRFYDWAREYDRTPRQLHVAEALEAMTYDPPPPPARAATGAPITRLVASARYDLYETRLAPGSTFALDPGACTVVMTISGHMELAAGGVPLDLGAGATVVVPAATPPALHAGSDGVVALVARLGSAAGASET
ncbi:MAG TPA: type I phosphomannose isomerase catalytic subunit [Acidimicrobiia bacterium]